MNLGYEGSGLIQFLMMVKEKYKFCKIVRIFAIYYSGWEGDIWGVDIIDSDGIGLRIGSNMGMLTVSSTDKVSTVSVSEITVKKNSDNNIFLELN